MVRALLISVAMAVAGLQVRGERIWQRVPASPYDAAAGAKGSVLTASRAIGMRSGNAAFVELMGGRCDAECKAQGPVGACRLPDGIERDAFGSDSGYRILCDVLRRAGLVRGAEKAAVRGKGKPPTVFDQVLNEGNAVRPPIPAKTLPFAACLRIDLPQNMAELQVRNNSGKDVSLVNTLRLPPHWKADVLKFGGGGLKAGETRTWEIELGARGSLAEMRGGAMTAVAQIDVSGGERLWVRTDFSRPLVHPDRGELPILCVGEGTRDVRTVSVPVAGDYVLWCWRGAKGFDKVLLNGREVKVSAKGRAAVRLESGENTVELRYPAGRGGATRYLFAVTAPDGDPRTEHLGSRVLYDEAFDVSRCGSRLPATLASAANAVTTNELCRWVQNADARSAPNALACDFSHLDAGTRGSPGKQHGWLSWWAAPNTNGWTVFRVSVKGQEGGFCGEIRGHFLHKDDPATKKPQWWIAYWINADESFRVRPHMSKNTVNLGKLVFNAWNDVEMWLPTEGNRSPVAYGRVNGGPWVEMDLGGMVMKGSYDLMQFGGSGKSKWLLDDILVTHEL